MVRKLAYLNFKLLALAIFLSGCFATPFESPLVKGKSLFIESLSDGSGSKFQTTKVKIGSSIDLFSILRTSSSEEYLENSVVTWTLVGSMGSLTVLDSGRKASFNGLSLGTGTLTAKNDDGKEASISIEVVVDETLSIETAADGSGSKLTVINIEQTKSIDLFSIIRNSSNSFLSNSDAVWNISNANASIVVNNSGKDIDLTGVSVGSSTLTITYGVDTLNITVNVLAFTPKVFRSVGVGATSAIVDNGSGASLTIAGETATFSSDVTANVGVGDVIVYAADAKLAFITSRIDARNFQVFLADGKTEADAVTANTDWSIFRAYTSLVDAENGVENTGLPNAIENFDTWVGGRDLVTNQEQWNIALYYGGFETITSTLSFEGWTTDANHGLKIFTPDKITEAVNRQRHIGKFDNNKYFLYVDAAASDHRGLMASTDNLTIDGLQIRVRNNGQTGASAIYINDSHAKSTYRHTYSNNIIHLVPTVEGINGIYINVSTADKANGEYRIYNNIIASTSQPVSKVMVGVTANATTYLYNNSIQNFSYAVDTASRAGKVLAKNNLAVECGNDPWRGAGTGNFLAASTNNITEVADTITAGDMASKAIKFEDLSSLDPRISSLDIEARGNAVNLSADTDLAFNTDITGNTRTRWDIGANTAATPIFRSVGAYSGAVHDNGGGSRSISITSGNMNFSYTYLKSSIGVGDAVVYSGDTEIVFIHERIDQRNFKVRNADGSVPADLASSANYNVYRAYKNIADMQSGSENTDIPAAVRDFDSHTGGKDLVTSDEQWNVALYADSKFTSALTLSGWTTSETHYLNIFAPNKSSEVGIAQGFQGRFDPFRVLFEGAHTRVVNAGVNHLKIKNIQFSTTRTMVGANIEGFRFSGSGSLYFEGNYIGETAGDADSDFDRGLSLDSIGSMGSAYVRNNLIYGFHQGLYMDWAPRNFIAAHNNTYINQVGGGSWIKGATHSNYSLVNNMTVNTGSKAYDQYAARAFQSLTNGDTGTDSPQSGVYESIVPKFNHTKIKDYRWDPDNFTGSIPVVGSTDLTRDAFLGVREDVMGASRTKFSLGYSEQADLHFRSIGAGSTAPIDSGGGADALSITSGVASFAAGQLAANIGVGDILIYDSNTKRAVVVAVVDANTLQVKKTDLSTADDVVADTSWDVFRAYTSLNDSDHFTENAGIPAGLRDFDSITTRDIDIRNQTYHFSMYADAAFSTRFNQQNWTSSEYNKIRLFSPKLATHVNSNQRHSGVWDTSKVHHISSAEVIDNYTAIDHGTTGTEVIGLQVENNKTAAGDTQGIDSRNQHGAYLLASHNIFKKTGVHADISYGIGVSAMGRSHVFINNNIIYGFSRGINVYTPGGENFGNVMVQVFNNTVIDSSSRGIEVCSYDADTYIEVKNNISTNSTTSDYVFCSIGTHDFFEISNNVSSDATIVGTNAYTNQTVNFSNAGAENYCLSNATDTSSKDRALDLNALISYGVITAEDIRGATRPASNWDIGACEAI